MRTPNLLDDALTNKTYVNYQQNDIPYSIKHRNAIQHVDEFINRPAISNLLSTCGLYNKIQYHYRKPQCKWYLVMKFADKDITAIFNTINDVITHSNLSSVTNRNNNLRNLCSGDINFLFVSTLSI